MATTVFTDWRSIDRTGHISDSILPGRVFQFRLSSYIWAYISDEAAGAAAQMLGVLGGVAFPVTGLGAKNVTQELVFQVVRGADAGGHGGLVVFEARLVCKLVLVALVQDAGAGTLMAIYTWNLVDSASSATVQVPGIPPDTLGTAQLDASPASGLGLTNAVIEINYDIVSPAWNFGLEPGDVIRIPFAAAGQPYVAKSTAVAVRTLLGGHVLHTLRDPRIGQSWFLYSSGTQVRVSSTLRLGGLPATGTHDLVTEKLASYGRLHRWGATLMALIGGPRTLLLAPFDDAPHGTVWKEIMNIETGVDLRASVSTPDGAIIYAYGRGAADEVTNDTSVGEPLHQDGPSYLVFKRGKDNVWSLAKRGPASGVGLPIQDIAALELSNGALRLTAKVDQIFKVWTSGNEGKSWEAA